MKRAVVGIAFPYDLAQSVNAVAGAICKTGQSPQIGHCACAVEKSMRGIRRGCIGLARNLSGGVYSVAETAGTPQSSPVRQRTPTVHKGPKSAAAPRIRVSCNLACGVYNPAHAIGITPQGLQGGHTFPAIPQSLG